MKAKLFRAFTFTLGGIACIPFIAHAGAVTPPPTGAPFDGGLSLLIAAGVGYASKKAYEKRKKDKMKAEIEK